MTKVDVSLIEKEINSFPKSIGKFPFSSKKKDEKKLKENLLALQQDGYNNLIENWIFGLISNSINKKNSSFPHL
jgi:hypothetical protein